MNTDKHTFELNLNYASELPFFLQVAYLLQKDLRAGRFANGTMPSAKQLGSATGVSPLIIENAYRVLTANDILGYDSKLGYFIKSRVSDRVQCPLTGMISIISKSVKGQD
ncbi:GntR family transcriptional regulator [Desertivirga brevis]|uniref:GntR family transcriptional regulator n=1 Tax=Desertivirga brevis TaxID=2810310 RepID=UPI001A96DBC7|nr:GntR family transcriptional regulator [Pedobacter sp. SYSU D00873]